MSCNGSVSTISFAVPAAWTSRTGWSSGYCCMWREFDVGRDGGRVELAEEERSVDGDADGVSRTRDVDGVDDDEARHDVGADGGERRFEETQTGDDAEGHPAFVGARAEDGDAVLGDAGIAGDGVDDATLALLGSHGDLVLVRGEHEGGEDVVLGRRRALDVGGGGGRDRLGDVEELVHDGGVDVLQVFRAFVDVVEGGERHVRGETLQRRVLRRANVHARPRGRLRFPTPRA